MITNTMSRTSPSGPEEATDLHSVAIELDAASPGAAGDYLVISEGGFGVLIIVDPTSGSFLETQGAANLGFVTRKGRIGFCRIASGIVLPMTGKVTLQWMVNNVKKGLAVDVSFATILPANPTVLDLGNAVVDFGDVEFSEGDYVGILATVGVGGLVGAGKLNFVLVYEVELEGGRPRA